MHGNSHAAEIIRARNSDECSDHLPIIIKDKSEQKTEFSSLEFDVVILLYCCCCSSLLSKYFLECCWVQCQSYSLLSLSLVQNCTFERKKWNGISKKMKEAETTTNYFPSSHVIMVWSLSVAVVPHFFAVIRRKNVGSARSGSAICDHLA